MAKIWLIFLTSVLLTTNCYAEDSAVFVQQDQKAPFTGILFTLDKADDLRKQVLDRDTLVDTNTSLNKSLDLQKQILSNKDNQINILLEQNDKIAQQLGREKSWSIWERFGWISVGAAAVIFGAHVAKSVR